MKNSMVTSWVAALVVLLSATAWAGPATDTVKSKQSQLFTLVAQPKSAARQAQLKSLFDEMIAYDRFAVGSLGKQWNKRTDAEKKLFSELLTRLIRNNYRRNLKRMLDFNIRYLGEASVAGATLVKTRAEHKTDAREEPFSIDFKLADVGGTQKVVDIITEDASMVRTYRSQFLRILRKDGFEKLIEKMNKKLAKSGG